MVTRWSFVLPPSGGFREPGPERRLPAWVAARSAAGGLLRSLLDWVTDDSRPVAERTRRIQDLATLPRAPLGEERLAWTCPCPFVPGEAIAVAWQATDEYGLVSGTARQATSRHEFDRALEPVCWSERGDRQLRFRNLPLREISAESPSGVYTISGEPLGLVPDADLYWIRAGDADWWALRAESVHLDPAAALAALPTTGTVTLRYQSERYRRALLSGSVTLTRAGSQSVSLPLTELPPENIFDGYGGLLGIPRLRREDNRNYQRRLLIEAAAPPDTTTGGVLRAVASRLGLVAGCAWDGVTDLDLDPNAASGITQVYVVGIPRLRQFEETLAGQENGTKFYATYGGWRPGWQIAVNGLPWREVTVSGNEVTFARPVSGTIAARYSVRTWWTEAGADGYIRTLKAGTGGTSGSYLVVLSRLTRTFGADQPEYRRERLLDAVGLPNAFFRELATQLAEGNPTVFGRAHWGPTAYWFDSAEDQPGSARLALPFDANPDT